MELSDQTAVLVLVKEHFNKATDADGQLVWESVRGLSLDDARHAITDHRVEKGDRAWRPDIKRVRALAYTRFNDRQKQRYQQERVVDWIKREARQSNDQRFDGLADTAAILLHFCDAWQIADDSSACAHGKASTRAAILNHARQAFRQIGMSEAQSAAMARECVNLGAGENIMQPMARGGPPKKLVGTETSPQSPSSWQAVKELSVAGANEAAA